MLFDPIGAGVNLVLGLIKQHKLDEWGKLLISCHFSGFCTFFATWGAGGIAHLKAGNPVELALAFGFCEGLIAMAAIVFYRFTHDPLAKGIKASVPASVIAAEDQIARDQNIATEESSRQ